jgi:dGTP triphosphohydrolase
MLFTREKLEQIEDQILAPYGLHSKNSRGRRFPEDEPLYRTCYQRDRDRILHTSAFRRLEYKTQVFINYEGDYYRTRLTHTLEVAQIGRSIASALGASEILTEAICLAHDLGHPAFGHSGEMTLAKLMKEYGGFDHNKQSLRILTELERRYPEFPGLNLTWEVLEGIVKHETEYDVSDARDYNPELRGHLEAQIANVADELTYTAHHSVEELQRLPYNVVSYGDDTRRRNREIKDFLYNKLYRHYRVMRQSVKAERIITNLYEAYRSTPSILPHHIQQIIPEYGLERTICDYIAGMTDRFAIEEHQKLFDADRLG